MIAIDIDALERMTFGSGLTGLELLRRGLDLLLDGDRAVRAESNDLGRAALYAGEARSYESDAAALADSKDAGTVYCFGGDHVAAHVYAAIAGARWVAALASLLGAAGPQRIGLEELQQLRESAEEREAGFGLYSLSLVEHLLPEVQRERWVGPLPLTSRIALVQKHGAEQPLIKTLCESWDAWRAA